jgi:replicative DNA helicase
MPDAVEHGQVVLAAIIPGRLDLLYKAQRHLTPDHFVDPVQSKLFTLMERYSDITGSVLTTAALEDLLRNSDASKSPLYLETYGLLEEKQVTDGDFSWSVSQMRELAAQSATLEAITDTMEIARTGKSLPSGEILQGHEAARVYVMEAFANIDRDLTMQEAPEGDIREEQQDLLQDYADRKTSYERGTSGGIQFGIRDLDRKVGGIQPGELALMAGYSSDGKTTLCTQLAWSAAIEQGKNVVFFTTETLRDQVRRKIVSRHSRLDIFGLPSGLNNKDLKTGTLSVDLEGKYREVVTDLTRNPAYGKLYIAQVPRSSTIASIEQRMFRLQRRFNIDLVVMDYLALLASTQRRQTQREELAAILKEAKQVCTTFDDGRGVPFVSPWQVSRAAREAAEKIQQYSSASLSETAEATNSADLIISLFAPPDTTDRYADVQLQILKARDGETANSLLTEVDYATSWFRSKDQFEPALTSSTSFVGPGGLSDLI